MGVSRYIYNAVAENMRLFVPCRLRLTYTLIYHSPATERSSAQPEPRHLKHVHFDDWPSLLPNSSVGISIEKIPELNGTCCNLMNEPDDIDVPFGWTLSYGVRELVLQRNLRSYQMGYMAGEQTR